MALQDQPDQRKMLRGSWARRVKPDLAVFNETKTVSPSPYSSSMLVAYISRSNLRHNAQVLKARCCPSVRLCAVVKADAYGHGARSVMAALSDLVDNFAVFTIEEAEQIYPWAKGKSILSMRPLFSGLDPELIHLAQARRVHCALCSAVALNYVNSVLDPALPRLNIHLKLDTGMGRAGCSGEEATQLVELIQASRGLRLAGIYTHFACSDEPDLEFTRRQLVVFKEALQRTGLADNHKVLRHTCNTITTLRLPEAHLDMVRCGLGLYGYVGQAFHGRYDLRPVLRVEAPLILVKSIPAGHACGYGRSFIAPRDMTIGIVPVGYADGLFRHLSNQAHCRIGEVIAPIIGRISMDQSIIDLSAVPNPAEGMVVTVIDDRVNSTCNAQSLADLAGTIPYEVMTALGYRIKRVLVD